MTEAKNLGSKSNDMGNEMTAFSILNFVTPEEVIKKVEDCTKGI